MPKVIEVLLVERPVQTPLLPERLHDLEVTLGSLAEARGDRIRRHQVRDDKRGEGHPNGQGDDEEQPARDVGLDSHGTWPLRRYDGVGITEFNVAFYHRDVETALEQIQLFAKEAMPAVR